MRRYPIEKERAIVLKVVEAIPELKRSYEEHLSDNYECLPYIYFPDAVRDLAQQRQSQSLQSDVYDRLTRTIEEVLQTDPEAENLIGMALLDDIRDTILWEEVKDRLGPRSLRALSDI